MLYHKHNGTMINSAQPEPIAFWGKKCTLHDYGDEKEVFDFYIGLPSHASKPFTTAYMKVVDVPQYEHFADDEYPEFLSYFLYGDEKDQGRFLVPYSH